MSKYNKHLNMLDIGSVKPCRSLLLSFYIEEVSVAVGKTQVLQKAPAAHTAAEQQSKVNAMHSREKSEWLQGN